MTCLRLETHKKRGLGTPMWRSEQWLNPVEEVSKITHPSAPELIVFDQCNMQNEQPEWKIAEQMSNLAKGRSGRRTASPPLKGLSAHSLAFTLETETAQMSCWCPQINKQQVKPAQPKQFILKPLRKPQRRRSKTATATTKHTSLCCS